MRLSNKAKKQGKKNLKNYPKKEKGKKKFKNPLDIFFSLGDRVTKGDPKRKADFDYCMFWIIFLAFLSILLSNLWNFIKTLNLVSLGWSFVMFGILWFQYQALKQMRDSRKLIKELLNKSPDKDAIADVMEKVEPVDEMLKDFKNGRK